MITKRQEQRPLAISYVRLSTEAQLRGDGERRQIEAAEAYAKANNLDLIEENQLRDRGISAFKGANRAEGALGIFLEAVQAKKFERGSYLLVESLDRLSREKPFEAFDLFSKIIRAGINIVTLTDNRVYSSQPDLGDLITSLVTMSRAHEESATKSIRVKAAWEKKRVKAQDEPIGGRCPGWLTHDKDQKQFIVNEQRAKIVRRIFKESASGIGNVVIMRRLNSENIPPFGNAEGWRSSSVAKILANRAVLGELQFHEQVGNKRVPIGAPIKDHFPAIIDEDLFDRAKNSRKQRLVSDHPRGGRTGKNFANLFSHISRCVYCNGPMTFEDKGGNGRNRYLVCSNARRGRKDICNIATSWRYDHFETSFLTFVEELDLASIMNSDADASARGKLQAEIEAMQGRLLSIEEKQQAAFALLEQSNIEFVRKQMTNLEQEHNSLAEKIAAKETELASLATNKAAFSEIKDVIGQLQNGGGDAYALRAQVANKLRSLIDAVYVASIGIPTEELKKLMDAVKEKNPDGVVNQRFFSVQFKGGVRKDVMPSLDDPSDYVEVVIDDAAVLRPDSQD